jgi:diadenosine tetraphosphate (Ap4A) HIT family hydrolase
MFSNPRIVKGQLLVIPNRHIERMSELKDYELLELIHVTNKYCDKILKFAEGYLIKNNYMPFLDESEKKVDHLHIHIIPRWNLDELYTKAIIHENELFKHLTEREYNEILEKMK